MKAFRILFLLVIVTAVTQIFGCMSARDHSGAVRGTTDRDLTVGTVQKEIRKGMGGAEVAEALGSPNIVTKDSDGNETWVYDKIATEVTYSQSQSALFLILWGEARQSGAVSSTQRTLTVVIKFNDKSKVDSFSYHSSKF